MGKFYADEDFPFQAVEALRQVGHDVLTAYESGNANQSTADTSVLAFAIGQQRAVLTMNRRDFIRLHMANTEHAGIIVCTRDPDSAALAKRIDAAVREYASLVGQLIRVNRPAR
jgi:hypothetical protein